MLRKMMILLLGLILFGSGLAGEASASTGFSLSFGSDNFYLSVGNYDYYPYTLPYYNRTPRISFHNVMADYGSWVSMPRFGQVWRPYVRSNWRPFVNGHWSYTRYGPTWVGYEPWAWAGYHYGNWIWSSQFGWVWIPGYDWHPGRVIWSHGADTIGWMPAPPQGYDYSRGYLDYGGSNDYYDDDFGYVDDNYYNDGYYGDYYGDRYNRGYNNPFYGSGYRNIVVNLFVFIDVNHYRHHNYGDYYLDSDYTRAMFDRRLVRISSQPMQRGTLERIVKHKINESSVKVREIETNNRKVKIVVPDGEEENIRRNANKVVKNVIAPAFAEKRREFKGLKSENATVVNKVFQQENRQPKIQKKTADEVLREIERDNGQVERNRKVLVREKTDKAIRNVEAAKTRGKQQEKVVRPGIEKKTNVPQREELKVSPKQEREFEVESRQKQTREEQFEPKDSNKKDRTVFEERQANPKPKLESKPVPKIRGQELENSDVRKEEPSESDRGRKLEQPDSRIEKKEVESEKRKVTSDKDQEQIDDQKKKEEDEEETDKKLKRKDSKKKKQDDRTR